MRIENSTILGDDCVAYHLDTPGELGDLDADVRALVSERLVEVLSEFPRSVEALAERATLPTLATWLRSAATSEPSIVIYDQTYGMPRKAFLEFDFGPRRTRRGSMSVWSVLVDFEVGNPPHCPAPLAEVYGLLGGFVIEYGASGSLISPADVQSLAEFPRSDWQWLFGEDTSVDPSQWWTWYECDGDYLCYRADGQSRWFGYEHAPMAGLIPTLGCVNDVFKVMYREKTGFDGSEQERLHNRS